MANALTGDFEAVLEVSAGTIDEVALYNPPLDPSRVRPHFDASRS